MAEAKIGRATINVKWFNNSHEHRNYWLRYGFMRLCRQGRLSYEEHPLAACVNSGFDAAVAAHEHRHTSVVSIEQGTQRVRCVVDSEDSFFYMSPLVRYADCYFCSGYNRRFFTQGTFIPPYAWQEPSEVEFYVRRARELVDDYGRHFGRVRPFVPICPDLNLKTSPGAAELKLRNAYDKFLRRVSSKTSWFFTFVDFERRHRKLLNLRKAPLRYDIVAQDTLWGWPRHRYSLHIQLRALAESGRTVHARLRWSDPVPMDGSDRRPVAAADFPFETGHVGDFESMLASSRLAVFATGFHWGWRSIMALALMWGLPVHADRLLLEPWFDMREFAMTWNDGPDWAGIRGALDAVTDEEHARIGERNRAAFDALLAPEKVAEYVLRTALAVDAPN